MRSRVCNFRHGGLELLIPRRSMHTSLAHESLSKNVVKSIAELPGRVQPTYKKTKSHNIYSLHWPSPPRNILLVQKNHSERASNALVEFARHIQTTYPAISIILEGHVAAVLKDFLPFQIYRDPSSNSNPKSLIGSRVDLVVTFGGDGTLLHASSLYSDCLSVSPILSFSLGTLGFLTSHQFASYATIFHKLYHSGSEFEGKEENEVAQVQMRQRLRVSLPPFSAIPGRFHPHWNTSITHVTHALNEVLVHRGSAPHLTRINIRILPHNPDSPISGQPQPLTTSIADGILLSTPTGSTAYSLSAGGSIVHPSVPCILITPICARSLSFRPLILPDDVEVELSLDKATRGNAEISIDGSVRGRISVHRKPREFSFTPDEPRQRMSLSDMESGRSGANAEKEEDDDRYEKRSGSGQEIGETLMGMTRRVDSETSEEADVIRVRKEEGWGIPTVIPDQHGSDGEAEGDGWASSLKRLLKFNSRFGDEN